MSPVFIEAIGKKFPNQFKVEQDEGDSVIIFPAKSADFGDVIIEEESLGSYILHVGKFTHSHFDMYGGSIERQIKEAAENISMWLKGIFADQIVAYGGEWGGGCGWKEQLKDTKHDLYVWSGLYRKA